MNENFMPSVRRSLYSKSDKKKSNQIKFSLENYGSENVFSLPVNKTKKSKTEKRDRSFSSVSDDIFLDTGSKYSEKGRKQKQNKKKKQKLVIDYTITPSTSESSDLTTKQKVNSSKKKKKRRLVIITDDGDSYDNFDLNQFFSTREQSFNESIIEPHSGIDYEFLSNGVGNPKITSGKIFEDYRNVQEQLKVQNKEDTTCSSDVRSKKVTPEVTEYISTGNNKEEKTCSSDVRSNELTEHISTDIENIIEKYERQVNVTQHRTSLKETSPARAVPLIEISSTEDNSSIPDTVDTRIENNQSNCRYFDLGHQKLVIIKGKRSVPCYGLCSLKVLHGKLEVLGCVLDKRSKEAKIYSPRGSSLLVVTNITDGEVDGIEEIEHILNSDETLKNLTIEKTSVVFICSKIDDCKITFVEKYISQQIFPKIDSSKSPQVIFDPKDRFNIVKINPEWDKILKSVTTSTKLLVTGGKGVGKSTFMRYSINKLLSRFQKVTVIDLDPGQSEFSIPGSISVVALSEPILGPNYTYLKRTDRSYLFNIDVGHEPNKYLKCIKTLMESVDLTEDIPILINYMGFAQGIGLNIVSSAITLVRPTDVIQINSRSHKKNFKTDLTPRTVRDSCFLFGGNSSNLHFKLFKISAMSDDNYGWSLESRQVREMCVLAYFGKVMKTGADSLTNHNLPMYRIRLNSIKITDNQGRSIPPAAVNAHLVALCSTIDNGFFNVLGYGIVRGADLRSETLTLITPEPIDVLEKVFSLVLGSVSLPPSIYMTPNGITGSIPYVMAGELESLGQITRRSYIPANRK